MKRPYQVADLNCWWNACAQGGFSQEVLFDFVNDTLDFLNIDSRIMACVQDESQAAGESSRW